MRIIDVSVHNGKIDWGKVKSAGVDGVIIRAGYGKGNTDKCFSANLLGVREAGFQYVGLYWFSYAYTEEMARREAQFVNDLACDYKNLFNLGVYFDWEYDSMNYAKKNGVIPNKKLITDMCISFCKRIAELGYIAGYYTNLDYQNNYIDVTRLDAFRKWFAKYSKTCGSPCYLWQYSSTASVDGIKGNVDINEYIGAGQEITGGHFEDELVDSLERPSKSNVEVAKEILEGKWGNGYQRKNRLAKAGYDYKEIQEIVNEMLDSNTKEMYVVKAGDTLGSIAKKHNTTVSKLAAKNNIKNVNKIYVGQKIYV